MSTRQPEQNIDHDFVVTAYRNGYFPMAESRTGPISWYSPDPRAILPLDEFKISRSLRRTVHKGIFEIRINTAFPRVIRACAGRAETWISDDMIRLYTLLHERGDVHSVEAWHGDSLAGGLYGVAIGGAFFGESMFSVETDASKVALVYLVARLRERGFLLLDTQFVNAHVLQFGAREIPRRAYLKLLAQALRVETGFVG
jgi:leucyl/phenylalanyl-tRNA--protein transferase